MPINCKPISHAKPAFTHISKPLSPSAGGRRKEGIMEAINWKKWTLVKPNTIRIAKQIIRMGVATEQELDFMLRRKSPETALAVRIILKTEKII